MVQKVLFGFCMQGECKHFLAESNQTANLLVRRTGSLSGCGVVCSRHHFRLVGSYALVIVDALFMQSNVLIKKFFPKKYFN